ncbi:MAG: (2Fe-2S)-binding protein, partial [Ruminococcus sp.]|nr:(2Fe-2S)-binding protein [Ruminococcus sp.]
SGSCRFLDVRNQEINQTEDFGPLFFDSSSISRMEPRFITYSEKEDFVATRKDILDPSKLSLEERNELIKKEPAYGTIVCRCESVTEGEIIDAIRRPLGARSLDGVKRRVRAGMGRCQGGFCSPKVMDILVREWGLSMQDITKSGGDSHIVIGRTKDGDE